jgi:RND family efflux transporter MFP subunit
MSILRPIMGAAAVLLLTVAPHLSAETHSTFAVSDTQLRALGIELVALSQQPPTAGARFPAQVILPPAQESVVSAPVAGLVTQVLVQEHQLVRAGTPLFILSSPTLGEQQLALIQAQNRVQLAQATASRERALFKDGIIAQRRVIEADAALSDASAALAQAKMSLSLTGVSASAISSQISNTLTVSAPTSATVTSLSAKLGQRVSAADPLLQLAKLDTLWLDIQVPSGDVARVTTGQRVQIAGGATATVLSVSPLTGSGQTAHVRAKVHSPTGLRVGEFVQVELAVSAGGAGWDIPLGAIARQGSQVVVFVRQKDSFNAVPIHVQSSAGQRAKVSGALKAGDRIAASSVIALKAAWQGIGGAEE